ncbi:MULTISPECIES: hypothetical protein [unclassified Neisseria]|uniref:hypothetical protein n=1 Tax=unclassified Neisseria TaxID=2623750 RepID=UPI00266557A2|nr:MULTISPECIES: hypothetical protein [unclassified Neisseria]MDO1510732.1 hypothetical protein [Neisseria sp. MVDL19-042950]MDO1517022.1 hypothetical protein [Neisseria sp. MVDL18-041461]MDO1564384.1 hypothetical protein [Neisseria sp. MVDL20-010259]
MNLPTGRESKYSRMQKQRPSERFVGKFSDGLRRAASLPAVGHCWEGEAGRDAHPTGLSSIKGRLKNHFITTNGFSDGLLHLPPQILPIHPHGASA